MKSVGQNNLILANQHFCTKGQDFNRYAKFTIIKRIEPDINMKPLTYKKRRQMNKKSENVSAIWI